MKHVGRTHRVDLDFLHQVMADPSITARYVNTKEQIADIFTKANFSAAQWNILCKNMQVGTTSISTAIATKEMKEHNKYVPDQCISLHMSSSPINACSECAHPPRGVSCGGSSTRQVGGNKITPNKSRPHCLVIKPISSTADKARTLERKPASDRGTLFSFAMALDPNGPSIQPPVEPSPPPLDDQPEPERSCDSSPGRQPRTLRSRSGSSEDPEKESKSDAP